MTQPEADNLYHRASKAVDEWLALHKGERFDLDLICRHLEIRDAAKRHAIVKKLSYEVQRGNLSKNDKVYIYKDSTLVLMNDWTNAEPGKNVYLAWPTGTDESEFGFENFIDIPEKGLIVIAGVTNTGKSALLRNLLWRNMRNYHFTYFSSETSKEDFADYASRMTWANPLDENGKPVFDLVDRHRDWQDVIQPNDINIVDWINMGDKFYALGELLAAMKAPLEHGVLAVAIQKDPNKELGMAGQWGEHLASLYITLDFERLTVKKAKKWRGCNPNGRTWGFTIVDYGAHFHHIRPLKKCGHCYQGKAKGQTCMVCNGTGFVDEEL